MSISPVVRARNQRETSAKTDKAARKPRLVDFDCGAGGCSEGYARAGFEVIGIDINPQPNYPFRFIQGDAMDFDRWLEELGPDVVHASPPCQDHSVTQFSHGGPTHGTGWMLDATVKAFKDSGLPWVIENVEGKSVTMDGQWATLCGTAFGLNLRRHRRFGSSLLLMPPPCQHAAFPLALGVNGHSEQGHVFRKWREAIGRTPLHADRCDAMGIDWMNRDELAQAIPPTFTEWVGAQLMSGYFTSFIPSDQEER